jgi:hypothetical protein
MDEKKWSRAGAILGASYIKRWLEARYDTLMALPALARLKAASPGVKYGIEAMLYALTAYAEQNVSDRSPLGLMVKAVLMDAAPEISARLLKDARAELAAEVSAPGQPTQQSVARKLLALDDAELFSILTSLEEMDEATRAKFLAFASGASPDELKRFGSLPSDRRNGLLNLQGAGNSSGNSAWMASAKSFLSDFWEVFTAWSQKTRDFSLRVMNRYLLALLALLKASGVMWGVAFIACTAASLCGRWTLLCAICCLLLASVGLILGGRRLGKGWLLVAGVLSAAVTSVLVLLVAADYADSVFAVAVLFLVGMPVLAIVAMLLPVTTVAEVFRKIFPEGDRTIVRASQMLLSAFFGLVFFAAFLLMFPPHNPVAFLFIFPIVIAISLGVGMGLVRINPEMFLRTPVLIGMAIVLCVTLGVMSMPNLRNKMSMLPKRLDLGLVDEPKPVSFSSSKDIDFVSMKDGEAKVWYAEQTSGGYDLFRCEGVGPYYAKDGRKLRKADNDTVRYAISIWVDQVAAQKLAQQHSAERIQAEQVQAQQEAIRKQQEQEIARRVVEEEAKRVQAEQSRRARYLVGGVTSPAVKVDYIVCAASSDKHPLEEFGAAIADQFKASGKKATASVLSTAFVEEGGFDAFLRGEGAADIQAMQLAARGERLLLVRCESTTRTASTTIAGLHSATVKVTFGPVDLADGKVADRFTITGTGPGTSDADAQAAAFSRVLEQLSKRGL